MRSSKVGVSWCFAFERFRYKPFPVSPTGLFSRLLALRSRKRCNTEKKLDSIPIPRETIINRIEKAGDEVRLMIGDELVKERESETATFAKLFSRLIKEKQ